MSERSDTCVVVVLWLCAALTPACVHVRETYTRQSVRDSTDVHREVEEEDEDKKMKRRRGKEEEEEKKRMKKKKKMKKKMKRERERERETGFSRENR